MHRATTSFCLAVLTAGVSAQSGFPLAYPQDSTATSQGHVLPFGYDVTRGFDECRLQQLIPARYLPSTAATIHGLAVVGASATADVGYDRLTITLSHARRDDLDARFDTNLPAPVVVLDGRFDSWALARDGWSELAFAVPFAHDGASDLVVEIRKVTTLDARAALQRIVATRLAGNPGRPNLPAPRWTAGPHGSGAADAPSALRALATPVAIRLLVSEPTLTVASDRGGRHGNVFALGGHAELAVHAPEGWPAAVLGQPIALAGPVAVAPVRGATWLCLPLAAVVGGRTATLAIPDDGRLDGLEAGFQGLVLDPGRGEAAWTCAVELVVNP